MTTDASAGAHAGGDLRMKVAEEVRALMGRRRVTGVQLAARIGKSRTYVSRRVLGETAFDLDDLEAISRVFDVPVLVLMGAPMQPAPTPQGNSLGAHFQPSTSATSARNRAASRWFEQDPDGLTCDDAALPEAS